MAAPKTTTTKPAYKPAAGICRHRTNGAYDCHTKIDRDGWSWCTAHVKAHREAVKAAKTKATPKAKTSAKPNATTTRPPRGKVVALKADEAPLDPMERELAAVKKMREDAAPKS